MKTTEVIYLGVKLDVQYTISGMYYAATREQPEEQPEIEIQKITASDSEIDLIAIFTERQLETIYNLLDF